MKKYGLGLICLLFLHSILVSGCKDDKEDIELDSCKGITVDNVVYHSNTSDLEFDLVTYSISDNCLTVLVEYSGCNEADVKLIASKDVAESNPPQRDIRFSFSGMGQCEKLIRSEHSFLIDKLKTSGTSMNLNVKNMGLSILYEY